MKKTCNILLIGRKLNGKSTFGGFLKEALGDAQAFSTSSYLLYRLSLMKGVSVEDILANKELYRDDLASLGSALCNVDAGVLTAICLWANTSRFAMVDGIRRVSEYEAAKEWFDEVIWVSRPIEQEGTDLFELNEGHATITILNNGDLATLKQQAGKVATDLISRYGS